MTQTAGMCGDWHCFRLAEVRFDSAVIFLTLSSWSRYSHFTSSQEVIIQGSEKAKVSHGPHHSLSFYTKEEKLLWELLNSLKSLLTCHSPKYVIWKPLVAGKPGEGKRLALSRIEWAVARDKVWVIDFHSSSIVSANNHFEYYYYCSYSTYFYCYN